MGLSSASPKTSNINIIKNKWRRGRDSNPRYGFPYTHFPGVRLQPLGHPSASRGALPRASDAHSPFAARAQGRRKRKRKAKGGAQAKGKRRRGQDRPRHDRCLPREMRAAASMRFLARFIGLHCAGGRVRGGRPRRGALDRQRNLGADLHRRGARLALAQGARRSTKVRRQPDRRLGVERRSVEGAVRPGLRRARPRRRPHVSRVASAAARDRAIEPGSLTRLADAAPKAATIFPLRRLCPRAIVSSWPAS